MGPPSVTISQHAASPAGGDEDERISSAAVPRVRGRTADDLVCAGPQDGARGSWLERGVLRPRGVGARTSEARQGQGPLMGFFDWVTVKHPAFVCSEGHD